MSFSYIRLGKLTKCYSFFRLLLLYIGTNTMIADATRAKMTSKVIFSL